MIECVKKNCNKRYIGETKRMLKSRIADHRGYVISGNTETATGAHFNSPGHSLSHMKVSVIEQVKKKDDNYRRIREKYHIEKFNTLNNGLNKQN